MQRHSQLTGSGEQPYHPYLRIYLDMVKPQINKETKHICLSLSLLYIYIYINIYIYIYIYIYILTLVEKKSYVHVQLV